VNKEGLTINNPRITDSLSKNHTYVADSLVVSSGGSKLSEGTDYSISFGEGNRSFTMTFASNVINAPVSITYSTRLNPDIIGTREVTNSIALTGGTENKQLATKKSSTTAQQWFYGG
ncbi:isopeptide-forming domain-containing fimbrial protein, partial [Klebsiella pneumoniae]|uniref:isopeptide-forming domain-containing fimbrial protein n=1 Tax=Klebsiella pneumoniae TaxID=573 RepID=UPI00402BD107